MSPDSPARASSEPELPRGVALAWGVAANPQRGPKRELSIERIVEVAAAIADAEGLAAVSMSRVAQALGFTTMSLYRYVSAKDDLLTLMQEFGTGVPPEPEPGDEELPWRERLRAHAAGVLSRYREHPWMLDIPIEGTPVTPNNLAWMDSALAILGDLPLSEDERVAMMLLITGQTRWQAIVERSYVESASAAGVDPQTIDDARDAMLDSLVTAEEFPALRRAVDAGVFRADDDPLAFGLERVLDSIEVYVEARAAGEPAVAVPPTIHEDPAVLADKKVREAHKARREAEKRLRDARKLERVALKEARTRLARS
ncbi:TetR/AcrR family transcriptional regulator [Agromyces silvae]|uniref:TetR/AcrR family transcriptional regulator n=1 Tax=Agromyces silvae TaxID=3388266 RepID=UPI00280C2D14|nr:TetR/AcrR family transcriptional regulator [Agromyces protaetiae]